VADRVYVMERGRIVLRGRTQDLKSELAEINRAYLATGTESIGASASAESPASADAPASTGASA
jgi:ABC-type glutathione transport system ATPase component